MPIFEYVCKACGKHFEAVLIGSQQPECPSCKGKELEQQLSTFAVRANHAPANQPTAPCGAPGGSCGGCQFSQ
jgi:putative FmdB family regulatory protein